jgi:hypothetical protein
MELLHWKFNGVNTLRQVTRYNANGDPEEETVIDPILLAAGLIAGCVVAKCGNEDDEERDPPDDEEEEEGPPIDLPE